MKRFCFPLERVLKLKRQRQRQAELKQLKAHWRWQKAQNELQDLRQELARTAELLATKSENPRLRSHRLTQCETATHIGQALDRAEQRCRKVAGELHRAEVERAGIAREVKTLEHLRERQWREHLRGAERVTQQKIDELLVHRWNHARSANTD